MNKIHLTLTAIQTFEGLNCQLLTVELKTGDRIISPGDLIELELKMLTQLTKQNSK